MGSGDPTAATPFDAQAFLDSAGAAREIVTYERSDTIFSQGDEADSVIYIQKGGVQLSVVSRAGREAVVAVLGPGDFCGEGSLAGQSTRTSTATALTPASVLVIARDEMLRVLHAEHALSDRFIAHVLDRNIRIEEDLIAQLFDSEAKRLAAVLLRLARYGTRQTPRRRLSNLSSATLADSIGTTGGRVETILETFERLGFVEQNPAGLTIHASLLRVVLHD